MKARSLIGVFSLDFELHLATLAHPMMLPIDKSVKVNSLAIIGCTDVTLHALELVAFGILSGNPGV